MDEATREMKSAADLASKMAEMMVQETQLNHLRREEKRLEQLVAADAATGKQLDDIRYQIQTLLKQQQVTRSQLALQQSTTGTTNRSIRSERPVLEKSVAQIQVDKRHECRTCCRVDSQ